MTRRTFTHLGVPAVRIVRGSAEDVPRLEPLWVAVHHAHARSMPELAPYVSDTETWAERSKLYRLLLSRPDTALFLALDGEELIGYGMSHIPSAEETWVADTWRTGARVAEVESLSVLPDYRGSGIGTALLDRLEAEIKAQGVEDLVVGVLPGNTEALRLYERRGFRPTWMYLSRFAGRPTTATERS